MIERGTVVISVAALLLVVTACGGGDGASSTIPVPSVAGPTTTTGSATTQARPAPPCETQVFLDLMRSQGEKFELSPAVLSALTPIGTPRCARGYGSVSFNGPPEDPGPFGALFATKPDQSGWELFSVDCLTSVDAGRRQVC